MGEARSEPSQHPSTVKNIFRAGARRAARRREILAAQSAPRGLGRWPAPTWNRCYEARAEIPSSPWRSAVCTETASTHSTFRQATWRSATPRRSSARPPWRRRLTPGPLPDGFPCGRRGVRRGTVAGGGRNTIDAAADRGTHCYRTRCCRHRPSWQPQGPIALNKLAGTAVVEGDLPRDSIHQLVSIG